MKRLLLFFLGFLFVIAACNKNQRQVERIDGKWNVVEATIQGYGKSDPDLIYEFEYCKLKKDDFCEFSVHNFTTDDVTSGVYSIEESGNTIALTISDGFGFSYREYTIVRSSFRKLILENDAVPNGEFSRLVLKKVN